MNPVEQHKSEVKAICHQHFVKDLYVFGSSLREDFDEEKSDIDFLVTFSNIPVEEYLDNYLSFMEKLENLFHRKIDMVEYNAIRNPVFKNMVDREKVLCYDREAA